MQLRRLLLQRVIVAGRRRDGCRIAVSRQRCRNCSLAGARRRTGGRRNAAGGARLRFAAVVAHLRQALDAQRLGDAQEGGEALLVDGHLAAVHEVEQRFHVGQRDVLEDEDRMLVIGCVGE